MEKNEQLKNESNELITYHFDIDSAVELFDTLNVYIELFKQHDPMYKKVMSGPQTSPAYPYTDPVTMFYGYLGFDILEHTIKEVENNV